MSWSILLMLGVCFFAIGIFYGCRSVDRENIIENLKRKAEEKETLELYQRVLCVAKHVCSCMEDVVNDCKYLRDNSNRFKMMALEDYLQSLASDTESKIMQIINKGTLKDLPEDTGKIIDRCLSVKKFNPKKKSTWEFVDKFRSMSDKEIMMQFVSEKDLENCKDLSFIVRSLKNAE